MKLIQYPLFDLADILPGDIVFSRDFYPGLKTIHFLPDVKLSQYLIV